jgi:hypothetical protein
MKFVAVGTSSEKMNHGDTEEAEVKPYSAPLRLGRETVRSDLADGYAITTKALNQAVKRNEVGSPEDFALQLTSRT